MVVRLCKASKLNNTGCVMKIIVNLQILLKSVWNLPLFHTGVQKIDKSQKNYSNSKKLQTSFEKPRSVTQYPTTKNCAQFFFVRFTKNWKILRNFLWGQLMYKWLMSYADENKPVSILSFEIRLITCYTDYQWFFFLLKCEKNVWLIHSMGNVYG